MCSSQVICISTRSERGGGVIKFSDECFDISGFLEEERFDLWNFSAENVIGCECLGRSGR